MSLSPVIPFAVFCFSFSFYAFVFIYRSKIFGPLWGVLGCVCWFALAGLNIGIFEAIAFGVSWLFCFGDCLFSGWGCVWVYESCGF